MAVLVVFYFNVYKDHWDSKHFLELSQTYNVMLYLIHTDYLFKIFPYSLTDCMQACFRFIYQYNGEKNCIQIIVYYNIIHPSMLTISLLVNFPLSYTGNFHFCFQRNVIWQFWLHLSYNLKIVPHQTINLSWFMEYMKDHW